MSNIRQFTPDEDSPLLLSWHRGELSAFEALVWKYQKRIFNLAILLTGDHETAATATENSFLTAYQNIRSLTGRSRFSTWLVAIALKECRNLNYFRAAELSPSEVPTPTGLNDTVNGDSPSAMAKKLALCIKDLPVELTEVILLRYVRGYSLEQMEEIFQIRADIIISRLFEAEESLTTCLKREIYKATGSSVQITEETAPHPEIRRNFSAYLDSSVENAEKGITKAHLKSCGSCREALADLEWMIEHLKSLPDEEPPQLLTSSIMQKAGSIQKNPAEQKEPSNLAIQVTAGMLLLAVIGLSAYLLTHREEPFTAKPGVEESQSGNSTVKTAPEKNPGATDMTSLFKGVFKGAVRFDDKRSKAVTPPPSSGSSPQGASPAAENSLLAPATKPEVPSTPFKAEPFQKREGAGSSPQLPSEWGDSPPPVRTLQKKAPAPRRNSSELSVVLSTSDPVAAIQEIETAVTSTGGEITGRAFSNGNDVLYTRIEAGKLIALTSRLGKVGKIQELPELPDNAEGMIDLVIRW